MPETWQYVAIANCGRCGLSEREHQFAADADQEGITILAALGGACRNFQASRLAVEKVARQGHAPKRSIRCARCGNQGHAAKDCPW